MVKALAVGGTGTVTTSIEATPELDLSDDEKRLICAQKHLNRVRELYNDLDRTDPDTGDLQLVQSTLSEAGLQLELAEYDETGKIKEAISRIERYLIAENNTSDSESLFIKRELALRAIDSAARTNPMHDL